MPRKNQPTREEVARQMENFRVLLLQNAKDVPIPEDDFYGIREEHDLAARSLGRSIDEILADRLPGESGPPPDEGAPGRPDEGSDPPPEHAKLPNEIEIESKPVAQTRRKRGQKTKEGQVTASRNALKHGIRSANPVVDEFETHEDWEAHRQAIRDDMNPEGAVEEDLAERYASITWRLRRVTRHETAAIRLDIAEYIQKQKDEEKRCLEGGEEYAAPEAHVHRATIESKAIPSTWAKNLRYEISLHRESLQILHELEAASARRYGVRLPLARLDVTTSG